MLTIPSFTSRIGTDAAAAGSTNYVTLGFGGGLSLANATEAPAQLQITTARIVLGVAIRIYTNATTASSTIKTRINGADGGLSVTVGAGATGIFTLTGTADTLALNDLYSLQIVVGTGGTMAWTVIRCLVQMAECVTQLASYGVGQSVPFAGTFYFGVGGDCRGALTETETPSVIGVAGTWRNLQVYVSANTWTGATTIRNRINGANGSMVATVNAGSGAVRVLDQTNSDTVAATDSLNYQIVVAAGSGTLTFKFFTSEFVATGAPQIVFFAGLIAENTSPALTKVWNAISVNSTIATSQAGPPTITEQTMPIGVPARVDLTFTEIYTSAHAADQFYRLMVNESAASTVTVGASVTGRRTNAPALNLLPTDTVAWEAQYTNNLQQVVYRNLHGAIMTLSVAADLAVQDGPDILASASSLAISASLAAVDRDDTLAAAATLALTAALAATEQDDTLASASTVALTAALAVQEEGDTLAAAATLAVTANLAVTDQPDTIASAAALAISAALAVQEEGDTLASSTTTAPERLADLAVTEQPDTLAASALVTDPRTADLAATDQPDTLAAAATVADAPAASPASPYLGGQIRRTRPRRSTTYVTPDTVPPLVSPRAAILARLAVQEEDDTLLAHATITGLSAQQQRRRRAALLLLAAS